MEETTTIEAWGSCKPKGNFPGGCLPTCAL